jgi:hypothetical protein
MEDLLDASFYMRSVSYQIRVCGSVCVSPYRLLANNSVKMFSRQRRSLGDVFYAVRVVSKESRLLVLPRTSSFLRHHAQATSGWLSSLLFNGYPVEEAGARSSVLPFSAEDMNTWSHAATSQHVFMAALLNRDPTSYFTDRSLLTSAN